MAVPPEPGGDATGNISGDIPGIADRPGEDMGSDEFEEDGPDNEVEGDFAGGGREVVDAQPEGALEQQQEGQGAGD